MPRDRLNHKRRKVSSRSRVGLSVNRRCGSSVSNGAVHRKEDLILPGRGRARPESLARSPSGPTQPASGSNARRRRGQARPIQEGSLRPGRYARLLSLLKHWPSYAWSVSSMTRLARTTDRVERDLARIQRLTTLTGESPTLFQDHPGKLRAHKSMTNRLGSRSGAGSGPTLLARGWQRPQSKAHARKGAPLWVATRPESSREQLDRAQKIPLRDRPASTGLKREAKKHSP